MKQIHSDDIIKIINLIIKNNENVIANKKIATQVEMPTQYTAHILYYLKYIGLGVVSNSRPTTFMCYNIDLIKEKLIKYKNYKNKFHVIYD